MVATITTGTLSGIDAKPVTVEVDLTAGIPGLTIVGLPDTAVNESKERIRTALKNSGFEFPLKKVVVNLAPADIRKEGTGFDLPITVGILLAAQALSATDFLPKTCFIGEVSLDGSLRRVNGALSMALMAKQLGYEYLVVPAENRIEAALVEGITVFGLKHLNELPIFLVHPHSYAQPVDREAVINRQQAKSPFNIDFADIKGQAAAKRGLEIAAAGGHNLLMVGPPGSGKSMLAKALPSILPPLMFEEMLEVSRIYSVAGLLSPQQQLITQRPFRHPHHSASKAGITGGGSNPKPGEITLSHRGVLFLDEFVEFPRDVLEVLRQPLEDGVVTISRAQQNTTFPAKFLLMAAMNPCPCGHLGDPVKTCTDSEHQIQRYMAKLSGPLLDRIDIHLEVPRLKDDDLLQSATVTDVQPKAEPSEVVRNRVIAARQRQSTRFAQTGIFANAEMTPAQIRAFCVLDVATTELLKRAVQRMNLSARAYDRILRLSRTIADLEGTDLVESHHVAEALQYRVLERLYQKRSLTTV